MPAVTTGEEQRLQVGEIPDDNTVYLGINPFRVVQHWMHAGGHRPAYIGIIIITHVNRLLDGDLGAFSGVM